MLLTEDRRQTSKELAERADVSTRSIYTILHRDLDKQKRQQLLENGVILFHDNAPAHVTQSFLDMLDAWDWEVLQHPPYSPDISPCDFFLIPQLRKLRGIRFDPAETIEDVVKAQVRRLDTEGVRPGIKGLLHR